MIIIIDFDLTLVDIHTRSEWTMKENDLVKHVRPVFITLIHKWKKRGHKIGIATFSKQTKLIQKLLKIVFPGYTFIVYGGMPEKFEQGKCEHIEKICKKVGEKKENVFFIDDDINNINIAKRNGFDCILFEENKPFYFFNRFNQLNQI